MSTDTSLRLTTDSFETINGQLELQICCEKYLKTENAGALHDSKLQNV